jgi:radical SAM superfamily enzyme YgiQ (UPF0313 family)
VRSSFAPHLLLINPWIYDFAAFDLWLKPMGLLYLAGHLRQHGYGVQLLDCLDRAHVELGKFPGAPLPKIQEYGVGKFPRQHIPTPAVLRDMSRPYRRYGIPEVVFVNRLNAIPEPAAILVTSIMTYWYPGVVRAIELVKQRFPNAPVILGGIYARLCPGHAQRYSQADYVAQECDPAPIIRIVDTITGYSPDLTGFQSLSGLSLFDVYPAFDLYAHLDYACLLTSIGCPYRCTYCAAHLLNPHFIQRSPDAVFRELLDDYEKLGIRHFAFYDDALLARSSDHMEPFLQQVIDAKLACSFHTPNGLHARYITERVAELMFRSGFKTIRLGLEMLDPERQQQTGGKVSGEECRQAVEFLKRAGFQGKQIGVYLFIGLPGQTMAETQETIRYVHNLGVIAHVCEYSPIPGTVDWTTLEQQGVVSADDDPLLHNNSVFIFLKERYTFEQMQALKDWVRSLNREVKAQ